MELEEQATAFISRFLEAGGPEREALAAQGAELAARLRRRAIGLAYSRATEFSPQLSLCHLLAAQVALLAYGPGSESLHIFERDIRYFRDFAATRPLAEEYESFRAAYTEGKGSS